MKRIRQNVKVNDDTISKCTATLPPHYAVKISNFNIDLDRSICGMFMLPIEIKSAAAAGQIKSNALPRPNFMANNNILFYNIKIEMNRHHIALNRSGWLKKDLQTGAYAVSADTLNWFRRRVGLRLREDENLDVHIQLARTNIRSGS